MKRFLSCLLVLLALSCSKFEESDIPYAYVNIEIDLRFQDKDLVPLLSYKEITQIGTFHKGIGFAGVLLVHGYDDIFYAYDLCCPHEVSKDIKIVADDTGYAKCPKCGTIYEIGLGTGAPNGASKYPLRRYTVTPKSASGQEWVVMNLN
ncbi:hypothetical protein [uncultured Parabacteroides sp.]|uniref:hypothetical protein n=1 Tax=uncultured Parabacteroides sp. TaxID=512312 RepID=UPI0025E45E5C|nr:hypothetical protein [uncultured Parabacteroides sp.]